MKKLKRFLSMMLAASMVIMLAACQGGWTGNNAAEDTNAPAAASADNTEKEYKDTVSVCVTTEPPMLDATLTTAAAARTVWQYIYEGMVAFDENFEPQPQLAERIEHNEDNTIWTFYLRKDVKFHNGKNMTAEDVAASLNRWAVTNGTVKGTVIKEDEKFEVIDDYTVQIELSDPCAMFLYYMANVGQYAAITTKEIVESADSSSGYKEYIGTGSMKFDEWKENAYIRLVKNDDYVGPGYERSGYSGDAQINFSEAYFYFISDQATRVNAALTSEYDIVEDINYDSLGLFEGNTDVAMTEGTVMLNILIMNKKNGCGSICENTDFRRAVNYALDLDEIAAVQCSAEEYRTVSSSYMPSFQKSWYTTSGDEYYNQKDAALAKSYLDKSGYNGEEVVLLVATNKQKYQDAGLIISDTLNKELGINVKIEYMDWATLLTRINQPDTFDMFITDLSMVAIPNSLACLSPNRTGFTNIPEITELLDSMKAAADVETAMKIWVDCQKLISEMAVNVPLSYTTSINSVTTKAEGYEPFNGICLWDMKIEK